MGLLRKPAFWIFALAVGVRLAWVATLPERLDWYDEREFVEIARHLVRGDGFVASSYRSNPVLPAYLAAMFTVFGESFLAARIGQCLLGALTCVLTFRIGLLLSGRAVGVLAGLLLAVYPPHVFVSGLFYVTCLFTFFAVATIHLALVALEQPHRLRWMALCGVTCAAGILTRPVLTPFVLVLAATWLFAARSTSAAIASGLGWKRAIAQTATLALSAAVVVLPWTARNYAAYGRVVPVSSGFYTHLWQGNNILADGGPDDRFLFWDSSYPFWTERLNRLDEPLRSQVRQQYADVAARVAKLRRDGYDRYLATDLVLKPVVLTQIRDEPARAVLLFTRKVGTLFSAFTKTDTANRYTSTAVRLFAALLFYPLLGLALAGAWIGRRDRRLLLVHGLILSVTIAYAALTPCTRYRLPLDPLLIVLGSMALLHVWSFIGVRHPSVLAAASLESKG